MSMLAILTFQPLIRDLVEILYAKRYYQTRTLSCKISTERISRTIKFARVFSWLTVSLPAAFLALKFYTNPIVKKFFLLYCWFWHIFNLALIYFMNISYQLDSNFHIISVFQNFHPLSDYLPCLCLLLASNRCLRRIARSIRVWRRCMSRRKLVLLCSHSQNIVVASDLYIPYCTDCSAGYPCNVPQRFFRTCSGSVDRTCSPPCSRRTPSFPCCSWMIVLQMWMALVINLL